MADAYIAYDGVFGCVVEGPVGGVDLSGKCIFFVSRESMIHAPIVLFVLCTMV